MRISKIVSEILAFCFCMILIDWLHRLTIAYLCLSNDFFPAFLLRRANLCYCKLFGTTTTQVATTRKFKRFKPQRTTGWSLEQAKYSISVCDPFPQLPINEQLTNRMYPWSVSFVDPWSWLFRFYLKVRFSPNHIDDIFSILAPTQSSYLKKKYLKITLLVVSLVYTCD